ncbi:MAG: CusA/CzcA family heavy metal efflux RND transporter [Nitrospiraceae bacterium]|uniref:efflux RND transporter permease subunit n=1 Tax=Nitrospira cf. moscoviensis SBR1015 TaxID=96242 RepID=UPI000A0B005D|nr:CusA/CzcA family heavy metal efflux RND transporter [Nitrospira cf. moscoviensis SBR1015]MBY0248509.1 CusA/CzcA family heavy metal efflux RND transporter [Nitrospiraceae bacterium]OQW32413.1 MAG: cation transporter [Nitrospira sp. SG-bin2]
MLARLIHGSARNPILVIICVGLLGAWGLWAGFKVPLDAVPDLSDVQVTIYTEWQGRSPTLIEDQVTYPIVTSLLAGPKVKRVRGVSEYGVSYVYVIFEDRTDLYWARSRVLEYLQKLTGKLPAGVAPTLGPDATGVGWVYQYALVDESGAHDLAQLRSLQDWHLRYQLESVPGVAEVSAVGGFVKQYQIEVDPNTLAAHRLPIKTIIEAVRNSNAEVSGRVLEMAGTEYVIRGRGYLRSIDDIELIPVGTDGRGTPILIRDIAHVQIGPDQRRGVAELDGKGQTVGGIVIMRAGENALAVIERVKARLAEITPALPQGVHIVPTYDRSDLIYRAIAVLREKLVEESIIVSLVAIVFLFHLRSALVAILILPVAVLLAFIPMAYLNITSSIMSLGGIAIAIGAMVDAAIVMVENAHKRLEQSPQADRIETIIAAAKEVGRPLFFSLLVIAVSFLPIFALEAQEGRLFTPLAYTKTFSMLFATALSVTLAPVLMVLLIRGRIRAEGKNPLNRLLVALYRPILSGALRVRWLTLALAVVIVGFTAPIFSRLGAEFMPPLNEGTILYMPTTVPGLSIPESAKVLQVQDQLLTSFPEVERVFGKMGKAPTATDPAFVGMAEITVTLKPESQWRPGMTWDRLLDEMDAKLRIPGFPNIWWMPIQTRTEMITTGVRSPVGIKVLGPDLKTIEKIGLEIEQALASVPGTKSAFAERLNEGYYLDLTVNRREAARYGLTVGDVQTVITSAIGGETVTTTVEGRERYPVNVRYKRELRDDPDRLKRVLIPTPTGAQIPIGQIADLVITQGPPSIADEAGSLAGLVSVSVSGRDLRGYVHDAQRAVRDRVTLPSGYRLIWTGQYEHLMRAEERLKLVVPVTIGIILLLLYLNFGSLAKSLIVLLSVPFAAIGAIWYLDYLGYNLSVAVWVGIIALAGVAAETGVVMLVYLDEAYERRVREGRMTTVQDLREAIMEGAVQRVRPKMMTVAAIMGGLLPIMWTTGTGADVMKRIAAPMIGGMVSSTILTLVVIPVLYMFWRGWPVSPADQPLPASANLARGVPEDT